MDTHTRLTKTSPANVSNQQVSPMAESPETPVETLEPSPDPITPELDVEPSEAPSPDPSRVGRFHCFWACLGSAYSAPAFQEVRDQDAH